MFQTFWPEDGVQASIRPTLLDVYLSANSYPNKYLSSLIKQRFTLVCLVLTSLETTLSENKRFQKIMNLLSESNRALFSKHLVYFRCY